MITLSESFCELVDDLIGAHVEQQSLNATGRSIDELVLTDLVENSVIDDEFGELIYDENGEWDEQADARVQNVVSEYIKSKLR